jgi:peptidoglycan/xylan/chitin deacetylase (PgdA/CDA1 family)
MSRLLPILYYHHVGEKREPFGHRRLWTSRERFAEQLAYLAAAGYRCITLRDGLRLLRGEGGDASRTVVLSFDDGYDNFYQHAYPLLLQHGFAATVFVVTRDIGGVSRWDEGFATALMDWTKIKEVHRHGIEIGSHTVSHPRLTTVPIESAQRELLQSRRELEDQLGAAAISFAYPYGNHSPLMQRLVSEAGYRLACSIRRGNLHAPEEMFSLKRVPVDDFTSLRRFRRRLTAIYDFTCRLQRLRRALRRRTAAGRDG